MCACVRIRAKGMQVTANNWSRFSATKTNVHRVRAPFPTASVLLWRAKGDENSGDNIISPSSAVSAEQLNGKLKIIESADGGMVATIQ